jgi:hypothetical protein
MRKQGLFLLSCAIIVLGASGVFSDEDGFRDEAWSISYHLKHTPMDQRSPDLPPLPVFPFLIDDHALDGPDVLVTAETNRTQSENSIAVSPLNNMVILNSNNSTDWPFTQIFGTSWFLSIDGGLTWTGESAGPDGVGNSGDPAAAIDRNGRLFIGYIDANGGQGVSYSDNNGTDWTHRTIALNGAGFFDLLDKNHLTVDNVATSPFEGRVYSAWTEFIAGGANDEDIVFSFSADGGNTWSAGANISNGVAAGAHNQGVNIQTGPNGEVYVAWSIYDVWPADENAIGFNMSTTGGASWVGETRIITGINGIRITTLPNENTRANSYPTMAVDVSGGSRNGWIYLFWTNTGIPGVNTGDADIYMSRSTNGGSTWSAATRVNDDATTNAQWFPWATVDPVSGDISVVFYDRRDDAGDLLTTEYVAYSSDGGSTWTNLRVGDVQFTPAPIPGLAVGYMGDYLGIGARGCAVYPSWGDWRTSRFTTYVSPLTIDDAPPTPTCPANVINIECDQSTDPSNTGSATAADLCDASPVIGFSDVVTPGACPQESTITRTWTATDSEGNVGSCVQTIDVVDTTAPTLGVVLDPDVLWPPNHKFWTITAAITVSDNCDADPDVTLISITSNEPDNSNGDGNTTNDVRDADIGTDDREFRLRAERRGGGDGRIYTVTYAAEDDCGNVTETSAEVRVPHDQSGSALTWSGIATDGSGLDPAARQWSLLIPSSAEFDALSVDTTRAYVGNYTGVQVPVDVAVVDFQQDGFFDLILVYDADRTRDLLSLSNRSLGLHYQAADGTDYSLPDVFELLPAITPPSIPETTEDDRIRETSRNLVADPL